MTVEEFSLVLYVFYFLVGKVCVFCERVLLWNEVDSNLILSFFFPNLFLWPPSVAGRVPLNRSIGPFFRLSVSYLGLLIFSET